STRKTRLPEPVKSSKKSSSKERSESKPNEKKEKEVSSKEHRSKSKDVKKDKERSSSKDKPKDKGKEKEKRSSSKSSSKDRTSKEEKSKSKRESPPPLPTPPLDPEVNTLEGGLVMCECEGQVAESPSSQRDIIHFSSPDSAKENRGSPPDAIQAKVEELNEEFGEVEEEVMEPVKEEVKYLFYPMIDQTPMMRRLQSRQGGRRPEIAKLIAQNTRVLSASERKISFSNATSANAVAVSESEKRYRILRNLIGGLERKTTVLIAQPPVKDYDFYTEMFGNSGKSQTFTQTGEDNITEESQTEQEETITKWTQHPAQANDDIGWGTEGLRAKYGHEDGDLHIFRGQSAAQSEALHKFMDTAAGVMFDLLASTRHNGEYFSMQNKSKFSFSAGFNSFQLVPTANESKITSIARSKTDEYAFLCAFYVVQSNHPSIIKRSLLVEYPLDKNAPPQRLFLAQSIANSTAYSEDGTMVFAGLQDGSIVAWDLYESATNFDHRIPWLDSKEGIALREPSFDTSFMSSILNDTRTMAIISVHVVSSSGSSIFQLCALDECGTVSTWTVERESKPSGAQGSRPGSRLMLTLSSIVRPDATVLRQSPSGYIMANCLAAMPDDQMQVLIGTDVGFIASISRGKGGGYSGPRLYKSPMHVFGEVLCIRFSPFEPKILATGLSTGSVSIHKAGQVAPLIILTPPNSSRTPVISIEWSPITSLVN
ncbi:hypothetical protein PFISCL1PPCAC_9839, partial [Pristionchus fissidentatus]